MKASPKSSPKGRTLARKSDLRSQPSVVFGRGWGWAVFIFSFLLYANTLNHGYVLDDDVVYLKNRNVQAGTAGIKDILTHSFTYGFTGLNDRMQSYRPVVLIVFAFEKQLFGNNPHTGHLINVLLFALACILLFHLVKRMFKALPFGQPQVAAGGHWGGVAVALLFAAHPIHTEAVANIKGRDEILNCIFFILSLSYLLRHIDEGKKKYFLLSIIFFFLALLCKEIAVTFLAIIPLTVLFFREIPIKKLSMGFLSFTGAFVLYMLIRNSVLDAVAVEEKMKVVNNALVAATNVPDRIATAILILGKYIQLLFFPHPLSWDYSFNQIPIVSFSNFNVIATLLVLSAMGIYALLTLIKLLNKPETVNRKPETAVFAYCILFFFLMMSVVSNIFIMIGSTLGERFLFVPSIAFCMAVAAALQSPSNTQPRARFPPFGGVRGGLFVLLLALFSFLAFTRNKDWKDNLSLFTAGVEATPNSSRAQSALGSSYREMGEKEPDPNKRVALFQKALVYYKKAIEILPDNTEALYNAGVAYYGMGDKENALKVYEQTLKVSPEYTNASNNAGVIYFERKDYENAKKYFLQAIKYDPNNSDALGNLGAINHNQGNTQEAIDYYKKALAINPGNQNVRGNLVKAEATLQGK